MKEKPVIVKDGQHLTEMKPGVFYMMEECVDSQGEMQHVVGAYTLEYIFQHFKSTRKRIAIMGEVS